MRTWTKRLLEPGGCLSCHDYAQAVGNNASPPVSDTLKGLERFKFGSEAEVKRDIQLEQSFSMMG